jgi:hypothetical protein
VLEGVPNALFLQLEITDLADHSIKLMQAPGQRNIYLFGYQVEEGPQFFYFYTECVDVFGVQIGNSYVESCLYLFEAAFEGVYNFLQCHSIMIVVFGKSREGRGPGHEVAQSGG